jgi:hypothetical protein
MSRIFAYRAGRAGLVFCILGIASLASGAADFIHPGLLQSREDLVRIRNSVSAKQEPTFSGYEVFRANAQSQSNYRMRGPLATVGRNPTVGQSDYDSDANAAYQCAIMWCITGDPAFANKSREIINAWSATLKSVTGRDSVLMAGLGPFKMINAAEILRYTDAGWSGAEIRQTEKHFHNVIYPVLQDFAPFANGNWDTAAIKTMMAIGVFCDDRAIFERALRYYVAGVGDGRLTHYIINDAGQCQESGRDQQHTQLGLAHLGDCCEIAWHQGLDLYGLEGNRLLKGFEYCARYNLGEDVPFVETWDRTGKYNHIAISTNGRGQFRAVFEQVYNHYANRVGLDAPFTRRVVERIRPEQIGGPGADHVGFGTLLFAQPHSSVTSTQLVPASPGGIVVGGKSHENNLSWVASVGAKNYTIKRATGDGDYKIIARNIAAPPFTDTKVRSGEVYRYAVSAENPAGESANSFPVSIAAGLPGPWMHLDVGSVFVAGDANFDGKCFTIEGAGRDIGGTNDQFHFACLPLNNSGTIVSRFVPQTSSQFSKFGLMMRETPAANAAFVGLLISPVVGKNAEVPGWRAQLIVRESGGAPAIVCAISDLLSEPMVTFSRMTGCCWLKLERTGENVSGSLSADGKEWTLIGTAKTPLKEKAFAGMAVCSGISNVATAVTFDSITASGWDGGSSYSSEEGAMENQGSDVIHIESPDGKVSVSFSLQSDGAPAYAITYRGRPMILESCLGFEPALTNGFSIAGVLTTNHAGSWSQVYGERKVVPDDYRELNVDLKHEHGQLVRLVFRAYDEGAAFRYTFVSPEKSEFTFTKELTEFRFPANTFGYEEHGTEGEYQRVKIAEIRPWCERPLTLEFADGAFASLGEAANQDYPRMLLSPSVARPDALVSALGGASSNLENNRSGEWPARLESGDSTPWRVLIVGEKPGDLLERNYLMLNLNPASTFKDVSWIKPGKVMRDTTLTMKNSKAIVDFACTAGLKYVLLDSGWYGTEEFEAGDATQSRAGPTRFGNPPQPMDIQELVRYGREKDVGVVLYVDRRQIKKQRDVLFPLYEKWGIAGVKIGFVDVGPQSETAWITDTIQKASEHHLLVNIHDGYRSTGLARTWPNLLTVEGVRGNEHMPTAQHNCTLPFTRYIAGAADYTVCYYNNRIQTSHAHQLAMAVISYSPLQSIFWYDRPDMYHGEPEIEFFRQVPTVWDDTKVINGEIGKFATIARRAGDNWFVGTINNGEPRRLKLPLNFLEADRQYIARVYYDDKSIPTRTQVGVESRAVSSSVTLDVPLQAAGGQAIWIVPDQLKKSR